MGAPGLMKLPPNEQLPRDKYEEKPEPTARPGLIVSLAVLAVNVCVLLKNTVLEALAAKPAPRETPVESGQKPAPLPEPAAITAPPSETGDGPRSNDAPDDALKSMKTMKLGLGQGRVVVFQSEDSLIVSHSRPGNSAPLPFAPVPVNDNGSAAPPVLADNTPVAATPPSVGGGEAAAAVSNAAAAPLGRSASAPPQSTASQGTTQPQSRQNRAPIVTSEITLSGLLIQQSLVIAMTDLLARIVDPDGDALMVRNLSPSMGEIVQVDATHWLYQADENDLGEVTFTYEVTDGAATVQARAHLEISEYPGTTIEGTEQADRIVGSPGADGIEAGGGDDLVFAREGADVVYGGPGNDRIVGGAGDDVLFGGAGDDTILGEGGDDLIHGEDGDDALYGGDGNDYIDGGRGNDVAFGGDGRDTVIGGDGDDRGHGDAGNDILLGGDGSDTLSGDDGDDIVHGDAGNDVLEGGDGRDTVIGGVGNDRVFGGAGNDVLIGGAGDDLIHGDAGDDLVQASTGDGDDFVDGGEGIDTIDLSATASPATIDLMAGTSQSVEAGEDVLANIENVIGSSGDDSITANEFLNIITGGSGADTFVFTTSASAGLSSGSRDQILDFEVGDRVDLDQISREFADQFEDVLRDEGIRKFVLIREGEAFTKPGEIRLMYENLEDGRVATVVQGNIDFDDAPEFEIELYAKDPGGITYQNFQY